MEAMLIEMSETAEPSILARARMTALHTGELHDELQEEFDDF